MSYKRLDPEDIVISADSVSTPAWSTNSATLTSFFTSSTQVAGDSGQYFYNVYYQNSSATADIQFTAGYGHKLGSGSLGYTYSTSGSSPSAVVYKSFRTLIKGDEETDLVFGSHTPEDIYAISIQRARFKEKLLPGSLTLKLSTSSGTISLTDNSNASTTVTFTDAGRVYELVSGSAGSINTSLNSSGYTPGSGSYGKFLPDVGLIVLNADALDGTVAQGGIALGTSITNNSNGLNNQKIWNAIKDGGSFRLNSEETLSSNYIFVRARNSEFNYSTNPSNITGSGELRHGIMIDSPQAYVTTVGLYNDNNDLLAVAKLSKPLLKDFTKESLIRIKLDY